jgi:hypothetical protein
MGPGMDHRAKHRLTEAIRERPGTRSRRCIQGANTGDRCQQACRLVGASLRRELSFKDIDPAVQLAPLEAQVVNQQTTTCAQCNGFPSQQRKGVVVHTSRPRACPEV